MQRRLVLAVAFFALCGVAGIIAAVGGDGGALWLAGASFAFVALGLVGMRSRVSVGLRDDGLMVSGLLGSRFLPWTDVVAFQPGSLFGTAGVVYEVTAAHHLRRPLWLRLLSTRTALLPTDGDPAPVAALLEERRRRAELVHAVAAPPAEAVDRPRARVPAAVGLLALSLVGVYAWQVAATGSLQAELDDGGPFMDGALFGPLVAEGEWWRVVTSAFLHGDPVHLLSNVFLLVLVGPTLERAVGHARFVGIYAVSLLAGSAGALVATPDAVTIGASGGIFGVLTATVVAEGRGARGTGGIAFVLLAVNVVYSFTAEGVSLGGHAGGAIGGAAAAFAVSARGRRGFRVRGPAQSFAALVLLGAVAAAVAWVAAERSL